MTLAERGGQTDLLLVHERFTSADSRARHLDGWNGCFTNLARVLGRSTGGKR